MRARGQILSAGQKRAVVAVVVREDARLLVIRRGPEARRAGHWGFVTGTIEPGEAEADAVVREVREEVGLEVRPERRVWESATDDGAYALAWWTARVAGGALAPDRREVSEALWLAVDEFLALSPTFSGDREFITRIWPALLNSSA